MNDYDIIIIGGGHAGVEAAWAAAGALGPDGRVALVTMDPSRIGQMSCNPAIGGLAKGQMVREVDALDGLMGRAIDATGIMFKMLNTSKGAAVRGPRAQADKYAYAVEIQRLLTLRPTIDVIAGTVDDFLFDGTTVTGIRVGAGAGIVKPVHGRIEAYLEGNDRSEPIFPAKPHTNGIIEGNTLRAASVVLTTGTFMRGLMHTGAHQTAGGRVDEGSATGIAAALRRLDFELGRLKTGTPPRIDRTTIDWSGLDIQVGDDVPIPFSDLSPAILPHNRFPMIPQTECRITHTTSAVHEVIQENLHRAPMYSGQIDAQTGPRYCPSIEDKVVRFADRASHHVFLEPESLHTNEVYCNGISTSLPTDVQERIVHGMPGCQDATILRLGYAVEYDMVRPHQIDSTCMTKRYPGLFLAGQINGTTGYEEAAGQGVIAGLNAALRSRGEELVRLGRDQAFIGVMLDDLVTKVPLEPYRMFTSRAEHRLLLRAENADTRLTPWGRTHGLVDDTRWTAFEHRRDQLTAIRESFATLRIDGQTLHDLARRPDSDVDDLLARLPHPADRRNVERIMIEARYEGYIRRQTAEIRRQQRGDQQGIPEWLSYADITGLRSEAAEVLARFRPATLGQAGRLAGVNPADVTLITVAIRRGRQHAGV